MADVQVRDIPGFSGSEIVIRVGRDEMMGGRFDLSEAMMEGAKEIAKAYVEEHVSEILGKLDPTAVANLALAESAQIIRTKFIDPKKEDKKDEGK